MSFWDSIIGEETELDVEVNANKKNEVSYTGTKKIKKLTDFEPKGNKVIYITKTGAFIKFEFLNNDSSYIKKIERYFTLRKKMLIGPVKQLKCCKVDKLKKRIIVPRFGIFELLNPIFNLSNYTTKSQISDGDDMEDELKWSGNLTENQKIIANHISDVYFTQSRVKHGSAGCILNLEAGQGKSYLAAYLISVIKKKTAIILHSTSLLMQWDKVLRNTFGTNVNIGYYYAKKKIDGDIVLMIIDSAGKDAFRVDGEEKSALDYYNQFGFIIYDECHIYSYKAAQKVLKVAQAPYVIGLSATPDENLHGFDRSVWWSLGPVLNAKDLPGYTTTSENFTADVHRIMYYGPNDYTRNIVNDATETIMIAPTINMICKDPYRNMLVVDCIKEGLDKGLYMFVFADRREYLLNLKKLLKEKLKIDGSIVDKEEDFVRIVGGSKDEEMEKAELKSKVIFTTYQYMGTGKSIIKMNGLILATPRKSKMKQYINRIFRLGSNATIKRHIWDICDMKTKLSNQWSVRNKYYTSKGYEITCQKAKYQDYMNRIKTDDKDQIAEEIDDKDQITEDIDNAENSEDIEVVEDEYPDSEDMLVINENKSIDNKQKIEIDSQLEEPKLGKKYPDGSKLTEKETKKKTVVNIDHNKRLEITQVILNKIMEN
jgi:hypothetical protein